MSTSGSRPTDAMVLSRERNAWVASPLLQHGHEGMNKCSDLNMCA